MKECQLFVVVSGSFNKDLHAIQIAIDDFRSHGIVVLSPKNTNPVSYDNGFVYFKGDVGTPKQIEKKHLCAIAKSDFLYIVNSDGYIGPSVAMEIGYALSKNVPVFASEEPKDEIFKKMLIYGDSISSLKQKIHKNKIEDKLFLNRSFNLNELQEYVSALVKIRGFSEEELTHVTLLLVEEVGELAKAVRADTGLKVANDASTNESAMKSELADCLIYLADLANLANISLEDAVRDKLNKDAKRSWAKAVANKITR